jgi:cleavage and polyadenylation specificity factor subunit 2
MTRPYGPNIVKDCESSCHARGIKFLYLELCIRCAPTIDLVLLSHGDLAHCGLYPWAYSRWGLKAPAYTTLPVQAMGRIAVTEDVEGIREEEEVIDEPSESQSVDEENPESGDEPLSAQDSKRKFIATVIEVQDAFDSCNTLRYSQPTHLQGKYVHLSQPAYTLRIQENAKD